MQVNILTYCPELNPQEHVWREVRKELSEILHEHKFDEVLDRACNILLTRKFDYRVFE